MQPGSAQPAPGDLPPRLALRGIGKRFGPTWVLRDVSLDVRPGQVHAVVGLNGSGKSTLMRAVYGAHQPTEGDILLDGVPCRFRGPRDALARGVAAVPQELPVVPDLSVTENIFLGMLPSAGGVIRERQAHRQAGRVLAHLHADTDVRRPVSSLDLAGQQLVTVARALIRHAGVLVFDEPTSALPERAAARLREVIRTLRADGEAILFISQRLVDVFDLADEITVLRDGRAVAQGPAGGFTAETIVHWMVHGRPPSAEAGEVPGTGLPLRGDRPPGATLPPETAPPALRVSHLATGRLRDVSFDVGPGELVGLFGLPGSGASEILRVIFGADPAAGGTVWLNGAELPAGVRRRIGRGLAYVAGDRQAALVSELSVAANIALPGSRRVARALRPGRERRVAAAQIAALRIQPPRADVPVSALSGGNQQKVVMARWLAGDPAVWLLDDPTRGVDAQAQADIQRIVRDRVQAGACGLIHSPDPRELHAICDRGLLVSGGRITAEIDPRTLDPDEIGGLLEGSKP
ncbi:MAG TPA: sugar ABC transporter ATP-binding protein [Streptosporangiaceae bacterium]|nr:sugar ABC transporter ATP-binding protein [Streptosporangiaceae bacterium]